MYNLLCVLKSCELWDLRVFKSREQSHDECVAESLLYHISLDIDLLHPHDELELKGAHELGLGLKLDPIPLTLTLDYVTACRLAVPYTTEAGCFLAVTYLSPNIHVWFILTGQVRVDKIIQGMNDLSNMVPVVFLALGGAPQLIHNILV